MRDRSCLLFVILDAVGDSCLVIVGACDERIDRGAHSGAHGVKSGKSLLLAVTNILDVVQLFLEIIDLLFAFIRSGILGIGVGETIAASAVPIGVLAAIPGSC